MPRYRFHTLHGRPFRDVEGEDLIDLAAAHRVALQIMGEILRDGSAAFWDAGPFRVICMNDQDAVVIALSADRMSCEVAANLLDAAGDDQAGATTH